MASASEKNQGQGDAIVSVVNIVSSNGKQFKDLVGDAPGWNSIVFTESMGLLAGDPQFISGEIVILDAINLFNEMALHGDEVIELTFKTPQKAEIGFIGKVYHIDLSQFETKRAVTLKFCSVEKIVADQLKFNRAYREVLYSDMANDIFSSLNKISGKKLYAETTKNKGSLVINNKSPIDALNTIKATSKSEKYFGANYVFFEKAVDPTGPTPDGLFMFASIESLVDPDEVEPVLTYFYDAPPPGLRATESLVRMKSYKVVGLPNIVSNVQRGMYAGTIISNDLMKRKIGYKTFNYDESYTKYKSVNYSEVSGSGQGTTALLNNPNYSNRPEGYTYFLPKHSGSFGTETNHADELEDTMLVRNSQLQQINAIRLQINVPGDSQRHVGEVVNIRIPAIEEKNDAGGGKLDTTFSGRYLISKIKHILTPTQGSYETIMMLIKDSYATPLPTKQ